MYSLKETAMPATHTPTRPANNSKKIGIGDFKRYALALPNEEFEEAMRSENSDKSIDDVRIIAQPLEAYERS
jgi:hypothetical protein